MTTPLQRAESIADNTDHPAWDTIAERILDRIDRIDRITHALLNKIDLVEGDDPDRPINPTAYASWCDRLNALDDAKREASAKYYGLPYA